MKVRDIEKMIKIDINNEINSLEQQLRRAIGIHGRVDRSYDDDDCDDDDDDCDDDDDDDDVFCCLYLAVIRP